MKSVNQHNRFLRLFLSSLTFILLFSFQLSAQEIDSTQVRKGKKIFNANCASCHKLQGKLIGPELGNVEDRRTDEWLKAWIRDNAALRASGDADAIAIFNEYNGSVMTAFPQLADSDIEAILAYTTPGDIDKKVVVSDGEEVVEEAVEAAKINAELNGLTNCEFIAGDVLKVIDDLALSVDKPDIIILDPPREGIHPKAMPKIINFGVNHIVYVSCKPTSLARDLQLLMNAGYEVEKWALVDMFPHTPHVECCSLLKKVK
jgi:mono/diheme cytochrome c family protein